MLNLVVSLITETDTHWPLCQECTSNEHNMRSWTPRHRLLQSNENVPSTSNHDPSQSHWQLQKCPDFIACLSGTLCLNQTLAICPLVPESRMAGDTP